MLEAIKDPEAFRQLDDRVLEEIKKSASQEQGMKKAQQILERIDSRNYYQSIGEIKDAKELVRWFFAYFYI